MDIPAKVVAVVRAIMGAPDDRGAPPQYMNMAWYRATVQTVSADGSTCDLTPDDSRVSGEKQVPTRVGLPGVTVTWKAGATILLSWIGGDPQRKFCALWDGTETVLGYVFNGSATFNGDVSLQHLVSAQSVVLGFSVPPVSTDPTHLVIDSTSSDRSGYFTLQGYSAGASVSVDITYARPFKNGSRAWCWPADATALQLGFCDNSGSGVGKPMFVSIDAANTNKNKMRATNSTASDKTPAGKFGFAIEGY